mmetsp:Transcript_40641/g.94383  ORF Transcript_40641/g.94383 Transcript_40641/m.94383 type:complete len:86 (+) Transcript_40641:172-429(+)
MQPGEGFRGTLCQQRKAPGTKHGTGQEAQHVKRIPQRWIPPFHCKGSGAVGNGPVGGMRISLEEDGHWKARATKTPELAQMVTLG